MVWGFEATSKLVLGDVTSGGSGGRATNTTGEQSSVLLLAFGRLLPDTCNGDRNFDTLRKHFEVCAAANGWDASKRSLVLSTRLRGMAFDIQEFQLVATLDERVTALSDGCPSSAQHTVSASHLHSQMHQLDEPFDIYAFALTDWFLKAYPAVASWEEPETAAREAKRLMSSKRIPSTL